MAPQVAETVSGGGYQLTYAPFLVAAIALAGPLLGAVPATLAWPMSLLYPPIAALVLSMFALAFSTGRRQMIATIALVLSGLGTNISATFFIDGYADSFYAAAVTIAAIVGWMCQFRIDHGRVRVRVRVGTHLVYFHAINFAQRFIALRLGVILADLLNQDILQNEPIAPGLADLFGIPEWAQGAIAELSDDQRRELVWLYVKLALGAHLLQLPLRIINPYYHMRIMQRINQDLRLALLERWHQLSLSYHSEHRTGDSIFRICQESALVTAVSGRLITLTLATMSYFSCVTLVTPLNPWLGLVTALLIPPALVWARWSMPRMRTRSLVYRAAASDVTSRIQESFGAIRLIQGVRDRRPGATRFRRGLRDRLQRLVPHAHAHRHHHVHRRRVVHDRRRVPDGDVGIPRRGGLRARTDRPRRRQLRRVESRERQLDQEAVRGSHHRHPRHPAQLADRAGHGHGPAACLRHPRHRTRRQGQARRRADDDVRDEIRYQDVAFSYEARSPCCCLGRPKR